MVDWRLELGFRLDSPTMSPIFLRRPPRPRCCSFLCMSMTEVEIAGESLSICIQDFLRNQVQWVSRCSLELAFCDQRSNRLSSKCAVYSRSNGLIIALFDASTQSLDNCSLQQAFKYGNRWQWSPLSQGSAARWVVQKLVQWSSKDLQDLVAACFYA